MRQQIAEGEKSMRDYHRAQQSFSREIAKYPKGTVFVSTETGYKISIPESAQLMRAERQMRTIEEEKHPAFIKEMAKAGFFAGQTVMAAGKPLISLFDIISGKKRQPWEVEQHFPSLLDIPLEPVGLAPKGSTAFLGRYPVHAVIGGGLAEIPIIWTYSKALKPVGVGLKYVGGKVAPTLKSLFLNLNWELNLSQLANILLVLLKLVMVNCLNQCINILVLLILR